MASPATELDDAPQRNHSRSGAILLTRSALENGRQSAKKKERELKHKSPSTFSSKGFFLKKVEATGFELESRKRSNSAADSRALYPRHSLRPDSAKTSENPARGAACRNTDEFPVPASAALIGRLFTSRRKGLSFTEFAVTSDAQARGKRNHRRAGSGEILALELQEWRRRTMV